MDPNTVLSSDEDSEMGSRSLNTNSKAIAKKQISKSSSASGSAKTKKQTSSATASTVAPAAASTTTSSGVTAPIGGTVPTLTPSTPTIDATPMPAISSNSAGKDNKLSTYKNYAGFHAKSMKVYWEQHDQHDTDVQPEVLGRLAEDATFKLWELANNLKTYSRHSGGFVSADIVNEVLKDSDVPPVVGAGVGQWEHVEFDGTYFFPTDEVLELRDEYLKEISTKQCGTLRLSSSWRFDAKAITDLRAFSKALCLAILTGDEETLEYAIHIAAISTAMPCVLRSGLRFCMKMLMFEYTEATLERVVEFLNAIVRNPHTRDTTNVDDQLYHLVQLLVCLVLGPLDLNVGMAAFQQEMLEQRQREYEINSIAKELQQSIKEEASSDAATRSWMDVDDIQNECEALLQMMENEGFEAPAFDAELKGIKISNTNGRATLLKQELFSDNNLPTSEYDVKSVKDEPFYDEEYVYHAANTSSTSSSYYKSPKLCDEDASQSSVTTFQDHDSQPHVADEKERAPSDDDLVAEPFSTLTTGQCSDDQLERVLTMIGGLTAKWGYVENEMVYLASKRLDIFFWGVTETTVLDYRWLGRAVRLLWTVGDLAFRELTVHLCKVDTLHTPEWIQYYFNASAIFLRGRDDIFLYEYLYDLCGDGLMPFMVYYTKYSERRLQRLRRRQDVHTNAALCLPGKHTLSTMAKPSRAPDAAPAPQLSALFPDRVQPKRHPRIGFSFAGSSPIRLRHNGENGVASSPGSLSLTNAQFNAKLTICHRRLVRKTGPDRTRFSGGDYYPYDFRKLVI